MELFPVDGGYTTESGIPYCSGRYVLETPGYASLNIEYFCLEHALFLTQCSLLNALCNLCIVNFAQKTTTIHQSIM